MLPLTVTVEKVGTDQARAKVAAGAPFAVEFTPTVVNGALPASDTKLAVAAGAVDGTAETVTRTSGTTAAVTVDIDLTTQPSLPTNHSGYEFAKATGSEPTEILPAETASTDATLSALSLGTGVTLSPTFASDTTTYTASVANSVEEVTFAPTKHAEATVRYLKGTDVLTDADGTDDGFQVALDVGANAITVEVTAEDGTTTQDYTVTVTRAAMMPMTPADVLVSNYPADSPSDFIVSFLDRDYIAQTFTAGAGFTLTAVGIHFRRVPDNARMTVSLHALDGSNPGRFLANLDLSGTLAVGRQHIRRARGHRRWRPERTSSGCGGAAATGTSSL